MAVIPAIYKLKSTKTGDIMPANFTRKEDAKPSRDLLNGKTDDNPGTNDWIISRGKDHRLGESND